MDQYRGDACPICLDAPPNCPVQISKNLCRCTRDITACLQCTRQYYQLDVAPNDRSTEGFKCMKCRAELNIQPVGLNAQRLYVKAYSLWTVIEGSDQSCKSCFAKFTSPCDLDRHLTSECPVNIVKCAARACQHRCRRCDEAAHIAQCRHYEKCRNCGERVLKDSFRQHNEVCRPVRMVECPACKVTIREFDRTEHVSCFNEVMLEINGIRREIAALQTRLERLHTTAEATEAFLFDD